MASRFLRLEESCLEQFAPVSAEISRNVLHDRFAFRNVG